MPRRRKHDHNDVAISNHVRGSRIRHQEIEAVAQTALDKLGYKRTFLSLVFVSDRQIKRLNQRFLKHSWATDVLAFPFEPLLGKHRWVKKPAKQPRFLGEVMISLDRARIHAKRFRVSVCEELARYICHGILHLSGFTDGTSRTKARMRRRENDLLALMQNHVNRIL